MILRFCQSTSNAIPLPSRFRPREACILGTSRFQRFEITGPESRQALMTSFSPPEKLSIEQMPWAFTNPNQSFKTYDVTTYHSTLNIHYISQTYNIQIQVLQAIVWHCLIFCVAVCKLPPELIYYTYVLHIIYCISTLALQNSIVRVQITGPCLEFPRQSASHRPAVEYMQCSFLRWCRRCWDIFGAPPQSNHLSRRPGWIEHSRAHVQIWWKSCPKCWISWPSLIPRDHWHNPPPRAATTRLLVEQLALNRISSRSLSCHIDSPKVQGPSQHKPSPIESALEPWHVSKKKFAKLFVNPNTVMWIMWIPYTNIYHRYSHLVHLVMPRCHV